MPELPATSTPRLIVQLTIALLAGLAIALSAYLWQVCSSIDQGGREKALRLAELMDYQTTESFRQVGRILSSAGQLAGRSELIQTTAFSQQMSAFAAGLPQISTLSIFDATGTALYNSNTRGAAAADPKAVAAQPWFRIHNAPGPAELYISEPQQSRGTDQWHLVLSRKVSKPDGTFAGVVAARIVSSYFRGFHKLLMLGAEDSLSIFHRNGTGFARHPFSNRIEGRNFAEGKLFSEILPVNPVGVSRPPAKTDGFLRLVAHRQLSDLPLVITLGIDDSAAFQRWYQLLVLLVSVYMLFAGMMIWLCRKLSRKTRALEHSRQALEDEKAFETTMFETSSSITFVLYPDGSICRANAAAEQITGRNRRQLLNRPFHELLVPEDSHYFQQWLANSSEDRVEQLRELRVPGPDNRCSVLSLRVVPLADREPRNGYRIISGIDITDRKKAEARIWHQANYDLLTNLPNRALLQDRAHQAISQQQRTLQPLALLFIDLDHFKQINDNYGHSVGDRVLVEFAERLKISVRQQDTAARFAGDEFIVLMPALQSPEEVDQICQRLLSNLQQPIQIDKLSILITASIGACICPRDAESLDAMINQADDAMYRAKVAGRNRYLSCDNTVELGSGTG